MKIDTVVKVVSCIILVCLWFSPVRGQSKSLGDTLTSKYVVAINNWLYGLDELAKKQLLNMPIRHGSTEQLSAWTLLLDEFYYWPGDYQRYLQLADSLHIATNFYSSAKLLSQQPSVQYQLQTDSLAIPIRLKHKSHPVIEVQINGQVCHLILDTGAQRTILSRRFVKRLGAVKLTELTVNNYNGKNVSGSLFTVDSLVLSNLTIKNLPVMEAQMPFLGIDGLLGWDILRQFTITIDYTNQRFTLCRSIRKPNAKTNLLGGSRPMLLTYGPTNNQLNVMLDTGANNEFSISPTGLTKIGPYQTKQHLTFSKAVGQLVHISREWFVKQINVQFDGENHSFKKSAIFRTDEIIGQIVKDGLIGSRAFRRGILLLDAPNHWFNYHHNLKQNQ